MAEMTAIAIFTRRKRGVILKTGLFITYSSGRRMAGRTSMAGRRMAGRRMAGRRMAGRCMAGRRMAGRRISGQAVSRIRTHLIAQVW